MLESEKRVAIITGSNSGIGRETAQSLAAKGYHVVLACRNRGLAAEAAERIRAAAPHASVEIGPRLDLGDNESVRDFAGEFQKAHPRLDVLVNNAGCNFGPHWSTEQGVVGMVQVNYLGPFYLTRLLEKQLQRSKGRVVNVSSVMHRVARMPSVDAFLTAKEEGIWRHSVFAKTPFKQLLNAVMAPPSEGCKAVVHAAVADWDSVNVSQYAAKTAGSGRSGGAPFFARGMYGAVAWGGAPTGLFGALVTGVKMLCVLCDQPLRALSGGRLAGGTAAVAPSREALNEDTARELWRRSCELCGVPEAVQI